MFGVVRRLLPWSSAICVRNMDQDPVQAHPKTVPPPFLVKASCSASDRDDPIPPWRNPFPLTSATQPFALYALSVQPVLTELHFAIAADSASSIEVVDCAQPHPFGGALAIAT
jgi:hypothetical protein